MGIATIIPNHYWCVVPKRLRKKLAKQSQSCISKTEEKSQGCDS